LLRQESSKFAEYLCRAFTELFVPYGEALQHLQGIRDEVDKIAKELFVFKVHVKEDFSKMPITDIVAFSDELKKKGPVNAKKLASGPASESITREQMKRNIDAALARFFALMETFKNQLSVVEGLKDVLVERADQMQDELVQHYDEEIDGEQSLPTFPNP